MTFVGVTRHITLVCEKYPDWASANEVDGAPLSARGSALYRLREFLLECAVLWIDRAVRCGSKIIESSQETETLMAYVIAEPCIGTKDTACVDACPVDCIHPKKDEPAYATEELLYIDPVECIDCGACVPVCPVSAIFALDDLPEKWNAFTERNAKYFGR
jgi:NAD-dependent dihydropyrimidine dehydrogenase PreA subunit